MADKESAPMATLTVGEGNGECEVLIQPATQNKGPFSKSLNIFESDVNADGEVTVTLKNFSGDTHTCFKRAALSLTTLRQAQSRLRRRCWRETAAKA